MPALRICVGAVSTPHTEHFILPFLSLGNSIQVDFDTALEHNFDTS
jgi:hypothetical protein